MSQIPYVQHLQMFILEVAAMLEVLSGKAIRAAENERTQEISGDYGFHLNSNLASRTFPLLHSAALSIGATNKGRRGICAGLVRLHEFELLD